MFDPSDVVEVRPLRGTGEARPLWFTAEQLPGEADALAQLNAEGWNVYAGVNPRVARGRKGNAAAPLARCLFADFDRTTVDVVRELLKALAFPGPTLIIDSGHGVHVYWRLAAPLESTLWLEWMKDLAALLGSDAAVCNADRVMRLGGFTNWKAEPVPCRVVECAAARVYDLADLPIPMRAGSDKPVPVFRVYRVAADDGGDRVGHCRHYLAKCPPAIEGQRGHRTTWHAANTCNRFGLTKAEALETLGWYSETRCVPSWSEKEIQHKVDDAYRRNAHEHGMKLREERKPANPVFAVRRIAGAA